MNKTEINKAKNNLIIIGTGKLAREAYSWAEDAILHGADFRLKGFLGEQTAEFTHESKLLGTTSEYAIEQNDVFVGAIEKTISKFAAFAEISHRGGKFINLIHPSAYVSQRANLGVGVVVGPFTSIACDATIGNHVWVASFTSIVPDVVIHDWCHVGTHCGINENVTLGEGVILEGHVAVNSRNIVGA